MPTEFDLLLEEIRAAEDNERLAKKHRQAEARRQAAEGHRRFAKALQSLPEISATLAKANQASASQRREEARQKVEASYTLLKSLAAEGKITGIEAAIAENRISYLLNRIGAPR